MASRGHTYRSGYRSLKTLGLGGLGVVMASLIGQPSLYASTTPNDPFFTYQEALSGTGSVADAWDMTHDASTIVVAVIDSGADMDHTDLLANFWVNAGETPDNGIDDDENGYVDDVHGYDFKDEDGDPDDVSGHGSITAGIIGAEGNNSIGTAGVAWKVQLMVLKVFGASGGGTISDFVEAIDYAVDHGAHVINASWTVTPNQSDERVSRLEEAMERAEDAGVLVIAAAGNEGQDLDASPVYPAAYDFDNIISVAATTTDGESLLDNSNYGDQRVHVAAPGEELLASYMGGGYATLTGTSAAAALVSGVSALMLSEQPDITPLQIREAFIDASLSEAALVGKVFSAGQLQVLASVQAAAALEVTEQSSGGGDASQGSGELAGGAEALSGGCSLIQ